MIRYQGCGLANTIRRGIACQFTSLAVKRLFQENAIFEVRLWPSRNRAETSFLCFYARSRHLSWTTKDMWIVCWL